MGEEFKHWRDSMQWNKPSTSGIQPPPLQKHTASLVGRKIFIIGGSYSQEDPIKNSVVEVFNNTLVFDTETMYWSYPECSGDVPTPRRSHSATTVDDKIFVFGGGDGPNYFNDLYILDTKTYEWKKPQTSGQQPGPRRAHTATLVGTKIFVFGGGDGAFALNETYVLDTEKLHWTLLSAKGSVPDPSGYHSAAVAGDKIVFFGGSDIQCCFSDMVVLDTSACVWTKKKLPSAKCRFAHSANAVGSWLFIFGGNDGREFLSELDFLELGVNAYLALQPAKL